MPPRRKRSKTAPACSETFSTKSLCNYRCDLSSGSSANALDKMPKKKSCGRSCGDKHLKTPGRDDENPLILVGLAISFALPTLAQQTNTAHPQLRQVVVAIDK
jgi:hypothetical protein